MSNCYKYFGVFSPKSNYLNFIVSFSVPDNLDALRLVRSVVYSKWDVREITFGDMLEYEAKCFYDINIGPHRFAVGAAHSIVPRAFFIKFARRHLSLARYEL